MEMYDFTFGDGRTYDAQGRNGFFRQTGIELFRRTPNFGEAGAEKGSPPPTGAQDVIVIAGTHARGTATGHLCIPVDAVPRLIQALREAALLPKENEKVA
jgi:hypothetical protein